MLHNDDIDDGVFIQRSENGNKTSRSDETDQTKTATMVDKWASTVAERNAALFTKVSGLEVRSRFDWTSENPSCEESILGNTHAISGHSISLENNQTTELGNNTVPELKDGGKSAKSVEEKLDVLTEKFFPNSNVGDTWVDDCESLDRFPHVTLHEINIALKAMVPLSASGHDGFPAIVFKEAPVRLRKVIQKLVQRCFEVP